MSIRDAIAICSVRRRTAMLSLVGVIAVSVFVSVTLPKGNAQSILPSPGFSNIVNRNFTNIGGIRIDAKGSLTSLPIRVSKDLHRQWLRNLAAAPGDMNKKTSLRMVSLRRLEEAIKKHVEKVAQGKNVELPDEIRYLAGLTRIQYIFVYPEQHDIILAGPAEGWTVNDQGTIVGIQSGRPVLHLDDLLVALRVANKPTKEAITISIDPTAEGIARFHRYAKTLRNIGSNVDPVKLQAQNRLGLQNITFSGLPMSSRFARVLLAADYRMKRIAMNLDPSPVRSLPSYMKMASPGGNAMPRWWLSADYKQLTKDPQGLAWKLDAPAVKCLTEDSIFDKKGKATRSGKANSQAQRWAELMTKNYDELAAKETCFAELRNCMDLAVVGALIAKERLVAKAGIKLPLLLDNEKLPIAQLHIPKTVSSQVSMVRKSRGWLMSVSGGVEINAWKAIENQAKTTDLAPARQHATSDSKSWWWN